MRVSVYGLGYIGSVCVAGILGLCDEIHIVDTDNDKINSIKNKNFSFPELEVANRINKAENIAINHSHDDLLASDAILICLPTEPKNGNDLDLSLVADALKELEAMKYQGEVVIRSTLNLNSTEVLNLFSNLNIFVVPEFLREGSALSDFEEVECLIVGSSRPNTSSKFVSKCLEPYSKQMVTTNIASAIFLKLLNNSWHALKVVFANEWRFMAEHVGGVDVLNVHKAFIADTRLNVSSAYLRPGGPFGGPCLTKDIAAFSGLSVPKSPSLFYQAIEFNKWHLEQLASTCNQRMEEKNFKSFSFDTLEFKKNTDDERHSPVWGIISLLETKYGKKYVASEIASAMCFCGRSLMDSGIVKII